MIRLILTYLFGIRWCRLKLCPSGYIKNGDLICPHCQITISKRRKSVTPPSEGTKTREIK